MSTPYEPVNFQVSTDDLIQLNNTLCDIGGLISQSNASVDPGCLGHPALIELFDGPNDFYQHWGDRRQQICDAIHKLSQGLAVAVQGYGDTEASIIKAVESGIGAMTGPPPDDTGGRPDRAGGPR